MIEPDHLKSLYDMTIICEASYFVFFSVVV